MDTIVVGIVAVIGGFVLGYRLAAWAAVRELRQVENTQAIDRAHFLQTLRRELANILVWRNPKRYLQLYREIHAEVSSLKSWRAEEARTRLSKLCEKYPWYFDFDAIHTREYVLYSDGVSHMTDDELEATYRDLVMFAALSVIDDKAWKWAESRAVHTTSDEELAHLIDYVKKIEDTQLRLRLERAIEDNYLARCDDIRNLDNAFYKIIDLPHFAENRYGIHLKRTNEFGIYAFFGDEKIHKIFYRTDPNFDTEEMLWPLTAVLEERRLER